MGRASTSSIDERDLERELLRKCVGLLSEDRHTCEDCGRTPLIGETVHRYEHGTAVCELCRPLRRSEPQRSERVRHSEYGHAVRVRRINSA